jgi:G3E family GTPase
MHDSHVSSFGMQFEGVFDANLLLALLQNIVVGHGPNLYRYKGILNIKNTKMKYVFHGVHQIFSGGAVEEEWKPGEPRINRLCFIGKDLPREEIEQGVLRCVESYIPGTQPTVHATHHA